MANNSQGQTQELPADWPPGCIPASPPMVDPTTGKPCPPMREPGLGDVGLECVIPILAGYCTFVSIADRDFEPVTRPVASGAKMVKAAADVKKVGAEKLKEMGLKDVKLAGKSYNAGKKALEKAGFKQTKTTDTGRKEFEHPVTKAKVTYDSGGALTSQQKPHWTIQDKGGTFHDRSGNPVTGPSPPMGGKHIPGG